MRNIGGKTLMSVTLSLGLSAGAGLFLRLPAQAACEPDLGSILCPPPPTPAPPPAPAPEAPAPSPAPAPAPTPAPSPNPEPAPAPTAKAMTPEQAAARLFDLINRDRTDQGLAALRLRDDLDRLAIDHSNDMAAAHQISHNDELFTPATKDRIGAKTVGENVASNSSIDDAHRRLMASPGHRANLLSPTFSLLGLGAVSADGTWYVTEVFITPRTSAPGTPATAAPVADSSGPRATPSRAPAVPRAARSIPTERSNVGPSATASVTAADGEATTDTAAGNATDPQVGIDLATDPSGRVERSGPTHPLRGSLASRLAHARLFLLVAFLLLLGVGCQAVRQVAVTFSVRPIAPIVELATDTGGRSRSLWHRFSWLTIRQTSAT